VIGACSLCGQLLTGKIKGPRILMGLPGQTDEDAKTQAELQEFDMLAQQMLLHVMERHPMEAQELAAVANLSSKVYAMRLARSSEQNFALLRTIWSETIKDALFRPWIEVEPQEAAASGDVSPSSSSSSSPGSGSKLKNSVRNFSN
jgi:hypothetical protein